MKKILTLMLLMTMALSFAGVSLHANTDQDTYDVTLTTMFDEDNGGIETDFKDNTYGDKIRLDDSFGNTDDHEFAFWVVNGAVRKDLPANHEFVIMDAMDIQAVFSPTSSHADGLKHASVFMDSNGQVIDTQYLPDGGDAVDPTQQVGETTHKEDFTNFSQSSYGDGTFIGVNDVEWTYENAYDQGYFQFKDDGYLSGTLDDGLSEVSMNLSAFGSGRSMDVIINGNTHTINDINETESTFTLDGFDIEGSYDFRIDSPSSSLKVHSIDFTTEPETIELPDKPGYIVNDTTQWDKDLNNIQDDSVFILQYKKDTSETFNLTVEDGSGAGTYDYNEVATVSADSAPSGETFSHWEVDGEIVSYQEGYSFTMLEDKTVSAVFQETPESEEPIVTLSDDLALRTGYESYLAQFEYSDDYTLIDYGMIGSAEDAPIELGDDGITKYTGSKYSGETNEFLMSLSENHTTLRAYLTLQDSDGTLTTHYSSTDAADVEPATYTETFDDFPVSGSTYESGTFTGVNDVEWSYTDVRGDNTLDDSKAATLSKVESDRDPHISATIEEGIRSFSVEFTNPFSTPAQLELFIDGESVGVSEEVDGEIGVFEIDDLDVSDEFDLELRATNGQTTIDNLTWDNNVAGSDDPEVTLNSSYWDADLSVSPSDKEPAGTEVTVSASDPNDDYAFLRWEDSSGNTVSEDADYTFTLEEDIELEAVFDNPDRVELTLDSNLYRADLSSDPSEMPVVPDTEITVSASDPDSEYDFVAWEDSEGHEVSTDSTFTYTIGSDDETLNAVFNIPEQEDYENMTLDELTDLDLSSEYDSLEGLYGDDLRTAIQNLISDVNLETYGDARTILADTDEDPDNSDNLILFYTRDSINGTWDNGATWNREHIWPQSYMPESADNSDANMASDLHALVPADTGENSSRGNQHFTLEGEGGYEPHDDVKGDTARMLFYMEVMYDDLTLVDGAPSDGAYEMGDLESLLEWHVSDDVSGFEEQRNDVVESYQDNRNPFIDYPHLAYLVHYDHPEVDLEE